MDKFKPLLDYINRVVDLTEEEERTLTSLISSRKLLKGQYFLQQGDVCKYSGFVISGCTKTFYVDDEGQEHVVMFSVEDWWTSDMGSYITQKPADFNVQCLENTELIQFSYENQQQKSNKKTDVECFQHSLAALSSPNEFTLISANQLIIQAQQIFGEEYNHQLHLNSAEIDLTSAISQLK